MEAVVAGAQERRTRAATKVKSPKQAVKASKQGTEPEDPALPTAEPSVGGRSARARKNELQRCVEPDIKKLRILSNTCQLRLQSDGFQTRENFPSRPEL